MQSVRCSSLRHNTFKLFSLHWPAHRPHATLERCQMSSHTGASLARRHDPAAWWTNAPTSGRRGGWGTVAPDCDVPARSGVNRLMSPSATAPSDLYCPWHRGCVPASGRRRYPRLSGASPRRGAAPNYTA